jgi:hypothetical protein
LAHPADGPKSGRGAHWVTNPISSARQRADRRYNGASGSRVRVPLAENIGFDIFAAKSGSVG